MSNQLSRRDLVRGMVAGAVSLSLFPQALAQVGPPPGKIALRWNENPYGPSAAAQKAAFDAVRKGAYYADDLVPVVLGTIAERNELALENMVLSSGSNEALQAEFVAWGKKGKILLPSVTYSDHLAYARRMGVELVTVPLKKDLSIDLDAMEAAVNDDISLVYICNPNNPTGLALDGDRLRDFCRTVGRKAVVVVDEAYNELTDNPGYTSMVDLVRDGENVIVMRTFSKIFGMAGMRVGYGMTRPDLAKIVSGHVMAWPNVAGLAAALASYTDDAFIEFSRGKIFEGRQMVIDTFRENGIEPLPSQANFLFADIGRDGAKFKHQMAERNILMQGGYPPYDNYIRVSMGRIEDIEVFQRVFTEVFNA
ncbi:MAG: histidinol-phosphate transaminase [Woeseiaceae bacterium]|nr:histidinol-phosphate transaminase [Woeseiaceae bacterium]